MKDKKTVENITNLSGVDLNAKLLDSAKSLFQLKLKKTELKRHHLHKMHRKNIARIHTEIRKRQIESL